MRKITAAVAHARAWLATWSGPRWAPEVAAQYRSLRNGHKLVLADLARYCMAYDNTFNAGNPRLSDFKAGQRDVWLHICAMMDVEGADILALQEGVRHLTEAEDETEQQGD